MKRIIVVLLSAMFLFTACQATPEAEIVADKTISGWDEYAVEPQNAAETEAYEAPERYESTSTSNNLAIEFDADVDVPDLVRFPIYILEPRVFTQADADRIIPALLEGAELYDEHNGRTKKYVQEQIDYYTLELESASNNESSANLVPVYQEILTELMKELETAPDSEARTVASRELTFKEVGNRLVSEYGRLVENRDGSFCYVWTEEARRKAAVDGNAAIDGVFTQACGRKMYLKLENGIYGSELYLSRVIEDNMGWQMENADYDEAEAIRRGAVLLDSMGLNCELTECTKAVMIEAEGTEPCSYYCLSYRTDVPDTRAVCFTAARNADEILSGYAIPLQQEEITIMMDGNGLYEFTWYHPVKIKAMDTPSVTLLPWDTLTEIMEKMLHVKNLWVRSWDSEDQSIVGRRLHIDSIVLSYMQVRKDAELDEYYYIPVWDVCGNLYYKFSDDYNPYAVEGGGLLVDENNERNMYGYSPDSYKTVSFLTINAIDGSVIDRQQGY